MDVYLGSILLFAGTFTIQGFAMCNGQLLSITQNTALFSLLGTTYGGDGTSTFALPDLRSRVPVHVGQGTGLSSYALGQSSGAETVTLNIQQIPAHSHFMNAASALGSASAPTNNFLAVTSISGPKPGDTYASASTGAQLNANAISVTGSGQSHANIQPYLALNFQIALTGIYPTRS